MGLKHQYVNVPIRAWQERYPLHSGTRKRMRVIKMSEWEHRHIYIKCWRTNLRKRQRECMRVRLRTIISVSSCKSDYQICVSAAQTRRSSSDGAHGQLNMHPGERTVMQARTVTHELPLLNKRANKVPFLLHDIVFLVHCSVVLH